MAGIHECLASGLQHHQSGRLRDAEQIYRQVLAIEPDQPDALHLLGLIAHQEGKHATAVAYMGRALQQNQNVADIHHNLGTTYRAMNRIPDAIGCYRRALELNPKQTGSLVNLGSLLRELGQGDEAIACFRRAIELQPQSAALYFQLGVTLNGQQRLDEAVACYRKSILLKPDHAEAFCNLGVALKSLGHLDEAISCQRCAIALNPGLVEAHRNLGNALRANGELDAAADCYQRVLKLKPGSADTQNSLGMAFSDQGKIDEAIACFRHAIEINPELAEAHCQLGIALVARGELDAAIVSYRRAVALRPNDAEAHNCLGLALVGLRHFDEAIACYRRAVELKPAFFEAHSNMGVAHLNRNEPRESVACFRRALELSLDCAEVYNNLGIALRELGKLDDAIVAFRKATSLQPDYPEVFNNLSAALKDQGELDESIACCRRALELKPDYVKAHSNLVYSMAFSPNCDSAAIYRECVRWNQRHAESLTAQALPCLNDRSPNRRLRIGYVSPDFRSHPVGRFVLPLLQEHNHHEFEIYCYSSTIAADQTTARIRSCVDVWCDVVGLSDERLAQRIRNDEIDILVDLTMHMLNNRLLVFARKPAPVQVTYLAYCGTTGMTAIDYRLTDPYLDFPGNDDRIYSEKSVWLPETYWCYRAEVSPDVKPAPVLQTGRITFGCLNNFCKVSLPTLDVWARLLREVPQSRLVLHGREGHLRGRIVRFFAERQIAAKRLEFIDLMPMSKYFDVYGTIDIALDPFPYGGGTTTCDALRMGVPVITLAGQTAVGRGGLSILSNLGLPELISSTLEDYVRVATELAEDSVRLVDLRSTLRERIENSPLMDAPRFARGVESVYREMWQRWLIL